MKYQLAHNFSIAKVPKIIGALTKNIEVGAGGGGEVSGKTVLSYALFAYHLPSGPLLPDADPGADRATPTSAPTRRTSRPPSRTG